MRNSYSVNVHKEDGTIIEGGEWYTGLSRAKRIAAKLYDARVESPNSPVVAIEIVNISGDTVQIERF